MGGKSFDELRFEATEYIAGASDAFTVDGELLYESSDYYLTYVHAEMKDVGLTTTEDALLDIDGDLLLANDTDPDGDALTIVSVESTGVGSVSLNPDGHIEYDPGDEYDGLLVGETATDTFTYTVQDASGNESTATVTVEIVGLFDDGDSLAAPVSEAEPVVAAIVPPPGVNMDGDF